MKGNERDLCNPSSLRVSLRLTIPRRYGVIYEVGILPHEPMKLQRFEMRRYW